MKKILLLALFACLIAATAHEWEVSEEQGWFEEYDKIKVDLKALRYGRRHYEEDWWVDEDGNKLDHHPWTEKKRCGKYWYQKCDEDDEDYDAYRWHHIFGMLDKFKRFVEEHKDLIECDEGCVFYNTTTDRFECQTEVIDVCYEHENTTICEQECDFDNFWKFNCETHEWECGENETCTDGYWKDPEEECTPHRPEPECHEECRYFNKANHRFECFKDCDEHGCSGKHCGYKDCWKWDASECEWACDDGEKCKNCYKITEGHPHGCKHCELKKHKPEKFSCDGMSNTEALFRIWKKAGGKKLNKKKWKVFFKHLKHDKPLPNVCAPSGEAYEDSAIPGITCKSDRVVELDWSKMGFKGKLSEAVKCLQQAKVINMSDNKLRGKIPALPANVQYVDLSDNKFEKLSKKICGLKHCHHMNIADNDFYDILECIQDKKICKKYGVEY
ncbi:hypothetical protein PCE1_001017 [Barthelona sp. PCE]